MLLAQFTFSDWVLRRVEKVEFGSDRRILRRTTIDFTVPEHAPAMLDEHGHQSWLVPLTVMRRGTLVNLDLRDEHGNPMSLMGLRFLRLVIS